MAMGKRTRARQPRMWVTTTDLPTAASHPFYTRLNQLLHQHGFDDFAEAQCALFYAETNRKRKKKGSNDEWTSPSDPDAKITKMKDGRTHLAHKAEHAVDLDTGAIVAVTIQGADAGDTRTLPDTLAEAIEQLDQVTDADRDPVALADEVVADKGCHSRALVLELSTHGFRTYISEPDRGGQSWIDQVDARDAVYGNRRRIRGDRGKRLLRRRGERIERTFAHAYETGGLRRTYLRGHANILKRVLVHVSGFNLGLVMRRLIGVGTPRGLQGHLRALLAWVASLSWMMTVLDGDHRASRSDTRWMVPPFIHRRFHSLVS
jgi:transposase